MLLSVRIKCDKTNSNHVLLSAELHDSLLNSLARQWVTPTNPTDAFIRWVLCCRSKIVLHHRMRVASIFEIGYSAMRRSMIRRMFFESQVIGYASGEQRECWTTD